jgi:hypothetical protein
MTSLSPQLLILGGLLLLVVAVALYLLKALVNYRGALRRARSNDLSTIPSNDIREAQPDRTAEDVFATDPVGHLDPLSAPLRTGAWKPDYLVTPVSAYPELSSDAADVVDLSPEPHVVPTEASLSEPVIESLDASIPTITSAPSTGSILSVPGSLPLSAPLSPRDEPLEKAHEYALVAPVELHFTTSGSRVGVRQGTRTFLEFQRLSDILWEDLRSSGGSRRLR